MGFPSPYVLSPRVSAASLSAIATSSVLGGSGTAVPHTGTLTETLLAAVTVPAGAMGLHGVLKIASLWSYTNSANNKAPRVRFSGLAGTAYYGNNLTTTASLWAVCMIWNAGAANAQRGMVSSVAPQGSSAAALVTSAVDTAAADTTVAFTATLANIGETITLQNYLVELLRP